MADSISPVWMPRAKQAGRDGRKTRRQPRRPNDTSGEAEDSDNPADLLSRQKARGPSEKTGEFEEERHGRIVDFEV